MRIRWWQTTWVVLVPPTTHIPSLTKIGHCVGREQSFTFWCWRDLTYIHLYILPYLHNASVTNENYVVLPAELAAHNKTNQNKTKQNKQNETKLCSGHSPQLLNTVVPLLMALHILLALSEKEKKKQTNKQEKMILYVGLINNDLKILKNLATITWARVWTWTKLTSPGSGKHIQGSRTLFKFITTKFQGQIWHFVFITVKCFKLCG